MGSCLAELDRTLATFQEGVCQTVFSFPKLEVKHDSTNLARTKRVCFSKRQNATDHFGISLLRFFVRQRLPAPAEFGTGMKGRSRDSLPLTDASHNAAVPPACADSAVCHLNLPGVCAQAADPALGTAALTCRGSQNFCALLAELGNKAEGKI